MLYPHGTMTIIASCAQIPTKLVLTIVVFSGNTGIDGKNEFGNLANFVPSCQR